MSEFILKTLLGAFGPSFIKKLFLRVLVSLQKKVAETENTYDDMILNALIEALSGEVDNDFGGDVTGEKVIADQKRRNFN
jgi:hypothetical protein